MLFVCLGLLRSLGGQDALVGPSGVQPSQDACFLSCSASPLIAAASLAPSLCCARPHGVCTELL